MVDELSGLLELAWSIRTQAQNSGNGVALALPKTWRGARTAAAGSGDTTPAGRPPRSAPAHRWLQCSSGSRQTLTTLHSVKGQRLITAAPATS